jgi:ribosomal protein L22
MNWQDILELIVAGGGAKMQYDAQRDALRRQQQEIAAAQAQQAQMQGQRQAQVLDMARMMTPQAATQQLEQVIAPQVTRLQGVAQQAAAPTGAAPTGSSERYNTEMARRAAAELERAIAEAGMAARAGGGQRLMFEQGLGQAQGASDLDTISSAMRQAARASQNRIQQAGRVDPRRMVAGGLMLAGAQPIAQGMTGLLGR